jgi:radical SAM superfamily enzyme YgiQ (UPF0313 family)
MCVAVNPELLEEILVYHAGKFLRIAPEHTEEPVLNLMRKPSFQVLESFVGLFHSINRGLKRRIELAPYLIVGHPGETWGDVTEMKKKLDSLGLKPVSVQIFTPAQEVSMHVLENVTFRSNPSLLKKSGIQTKEPVDPKISWTYL